MNKDEQKKSQPKDIEDYSKEELVEIVKRLAEIPALSTESLNDLSYDDENLKEGIKVGSRIAGIYLALVSAGMDEEQAYQLCINESTSKNNVDCAKINSVQQQITSGTI